MDTHEALDRVPDPGVLRGARVVLEPLEVAHAAEMSRLLDDHGLHTFIGGAPVSEPELAERYRRQVAGWSADRSERWLNWVVRRTVDDEVVGTVQATVTSSEDGLTAEAAWVVGTAYQGLGYAKEAASTMAVWLRRHGVVLLVAHVHPDHHASQAVARALGLANTGTWHDGEERWEG